MSSQVLAIRLFLLLCFPLLVKPAPGANIAVGSVITADERNREAAAWFSHSRLFAFGFYPVENEFAVGIWFVPDNTVIWTADRDSELLPERSKLNFTEDGLQIPSSNGDRSIANISTTNSVKLASAYMKDCGNFVIQDVNNNIIWQTFDHPTDTLMAGQVLFAGNKTVSSVSSTNHSSGRFQLVMQENGNYVAYPVNTPATSAHFYWSSNTSGDGYTGILLDENGEIFPIRESPNATQNSTLLSSATCLARIETDGFLRIYNISSNSMQLTKTLPAGDVGVNKCSIKGACGPNSYCNFTATVTATAAADNISTGFFQGEAACLCFPGFDYTDWRKPYMGCQRNFSMGQFIKENNISYSITKIANISWSDDPYAYTENRSEKECGESCFEDSNCYAALFFAHQRCSKQRHPLLYGRLSESTVAFLKVGSGEMQLPTQSPLGEVVDVVPKRKTLFLIMALASASFFSVAVTIFFFYKNRGPSYQKLCRNMETGLAGGLAPRSFTHQQLVEATDGFTKDIGNGNFSTVFKGEIPLNNGEMMPIAVKRLNEKLSKETEKGFRTEMRAVGRAHHRNVVRLLGFCHEGPKWLLIYEYMSRGSLADLIFQHDKTQALPSWKERANIAMDVARGILYLHEGCETTIIHSDIKPHNVLVGDDGTAKIGDLGLAKLLRPRQSKTYTRHRGTLWYQAPEWRKEASEPVSPKVDVYSFGVLLLELITCRSRFLGEPVNDCIFLSELAYKCLMESTLELLVPEGEVVDNVELKKMVMVALWCVQKEPGHRKSMKEVVRMLGGKMTIAFPPDSVF
ncbi:hypothetical protein IEQ34_010578 [Dendrobium chrysotoxum]|uniref:Receptor-like serine/threonine-protein kinase n=1 Tax=Dendrobium chrysotoxum TaxID=161865 RepID=A0AAV7GDS0_DENCH|nr:hypothetical protein IEQ34_010578 [Dendrobium chrysotoxum]